MNASSPLVKRSRRTPSIRISNFSPDAVLNESVFELIGELEIDGAEYLAFMPIESDDCEYVILKKERDENGEETLVTIDDDDEFERVAEEFEDRLMDELDLDELDGDNEDED